MWNIKKTIMILLVAFILVVSCGIGSAYTETRLSTNTADQTNPSLWGNYVVWQDARNGGSDIYLTDMAKKVQTQVTKGVDAENSCVSGNRIVWQDKRNGNWDIYMYEISSKKTTRITTDTADQTYPGVYGNMIVWEDNRENPGPGIYLLDLSAKTEVRLTSNGWSPAIYGNNIVWFTEDDQGVGKIILYDIPTKKTTVILNGGMISYSLSIYGDKVIYNDMYTGMFTGLYDFSAKTWIELPFMYVENPAIYSNKIVYDDNRNENSDIYMVTLGSEIPYADFSASMTSGNAPLTVKFTDKSTGSPTEWKWSFGDGSALVTESNPAHIYSKPGTYTVKLTASNAAGKDTEIKTNYITVTSTLKAPVAALSASPTSGNAPLKVQFSDKSSNSPTSWKWDFGDKLSSTEKNPVHTYSTAGTYTVKLTASNAAGSNTVTKKSYITVKKGSTSSNVYISNLRLGASRETPNQEYVQITNKGTTNVKMSGWRITDSGSKHTYYFPSSYTLKSKSTVTLYSGKGTNTATKLYWGRTSHVWNNEGDTAYLFDAQGTLVSKLTK